MTLNSQNTDGSAPQNIFESLWNNEQFKSGLRTALQTVGTAVAGKGLIDESMIPTFVGAIMWLIPTVWGLYVRRKDGLVASAAALPEVKKIETTPDMAARIPDPTVVAKS